MTTLLIAFYCNIALGYYMETYYACQQLNSRVQQLMSLAAGKCSDSKAVSLANLPSHRIPAFDSRCL